MDNSKPFAARMQDFFSALLREFALSVPRLDAELKARSR